MRFVLRDVNNLDEAKYAGGRTNIGITVANALIRAFVKYAAQNVLDPSIGKEYTVDVTDEMEELKKRAPDRTVTRSDGTEKIIPSKFNLNIKKFGIRIADSFSSSDYAGVYYDKHETIYVRTMLPYGTYDYELYLESISPKVKNFTEEQFNEKLKKALLTVLKTAIQNSVEYKRNPEAYTTLDRLKELYKTKNYNPAPEYTSSKLANESNIKNLKNPVMLKTQEDVNKSIKKVAPSKAKMNSIYSMFKRQEVDKQIYSIIVHEVKHGRQYSGEKGDDLSSKKLEKLGNLFDKNNLLLLPTFMYTSNTTDRDKDLVDNFYYYSRPYEIDARLSQYRQEYAERKRIEPATNIFDIITNREDKFANRLRPTVPYMYRTAEKIIGEELKYKLLSQVFNQIVKSAKEISSKDKRFEELAQEYKNKVTEINSALRSDTNLTTQIDNFDPVSRISLTRDLPSR